MFKSYIISAGTSKEFLFKNEEVAYYQENPNQNALIITDLRSGELSLLPHKAAPSFNHITDEHLRFTLLLGADAYLYIARSPAKNGS